MHKQTQRQDRQKERQKGRLQNIDRWGWGRLAPSCVPVQRWSPPLSLRPWPSVSPPVARSHGSWEPAGAEDPLLGGLGSVWVWGQDSQVAGTEGRRDGM